MTDSLLVGCRITTSGGWIDLMKPPYRLSADAFAEQQVSWRRSDVSSPFVEGSWTVNAVRENVTETLDVWVRCEDTSALAVAVEELLAALSQLNYGIELTFDNVRSFYQCYVADVAVKSPREFRFSRMAQVSAQVPRHPVARVMNVAPLESGVV